MNSRYRLPRLAVPLPPADASILYKPTVGSDGLYQRQHTAFGSLSNTKPQNKPSSSSSSSVSENTAVQAALNAVHQANRVTTTNPPIPSISKASVDDTKRPVLTTSDPMADPTWPAPSLSSLSLSSPSSSSSIPTGFWPSNEYPNNLPDATETVFSNNNSLNGAVGPDSVWKTLFNLSPEDVYGLPERYRVWFGKVCPNGMDCKIRYCVRIHGHYEPNQAKIYDADMQKYGCDRGYGYVACRDYLLARKCTRGVGCSFRHFADWRPLTANQAMAILASFFFNSMAILSAASDCRSATAAATGGPIPATAASMPATAASIQPVFAPNNPNPKPVAAAAKKTIGRFNPDRPRLPRMDRQTVFEHRSALEASVLRQHL